MFFQVFKTATGYLLLCVKGVANAVIGNDGSNDV
jgi:hypothetical protein